MPATATLMSLALPVVLAVVDMLWPDKGPTRPGARDFLDTRVFLLPPDFSKFAEVKKVDSVVFVLVQVPRNS